MPPDELSEKLNEGIEIAKEHGIDVDNQDSGARDHIEKTFVANYFNVSAPVVRRRVDDDGLWELRD